jgi:hypothetical protein
MRREREKKQRERQRDRKRRERSVSHGMMVVVFVVVVVVAVVWVCHCVRPFLWPPQFFYLQASLRARPRLPSASAACRGLMHPPTRLVKQEAKLEQHTDQSMISQINHKTNTGQLPMTPATNEMWWPNAKLHARSIRSTFVRSM